MNFRSRWRVSSRRLIRAMPWVFVLIWSTGFIVARFGMPQAPPMSFLTIRYGLSIACFLVWVVLSGAAWPRSRAQWAASGADRRADACRLSRWRVGCGQGRHRRRHGGPAGRPAAGADRDLDQPQRGCRAPVTPRRAAGPAALRHDRQRCSGSAWRSASAACCWWSGASSASARSMAGTCRWRCSRWSASPSARLYQKRHVQPCDVRTASIDPACRRLARQPAIRCVRVRGDSLERDISSARWPGRCLV